MKRSYWVLVVFVATLVCRGNCRPREVKNVYPVYRSVKELQVEQIHRYEKPFKDDSVTYLRIDIPHRNVSDSTPEQKNNSTSIIDYVPVALTVKRPNIKKWPSDQNGIESADDLSLYNVYTNNINPLFHHPTTPPYGLHFPYTSHHKPSILILEELTTRNPFHDQNNVHTGPIQVLDRPPPPHLYPLHVVTPEPPLHPEWPDHPYERPPPPPLYHPPPQGLTTSSTPPTTLEPRPESSTTRQETTTVKCPNVSVTANTVINNSNGVKKEGCQDISIHINTNVNNSNTGLLRPGRPAPTAPTGVSEVISAVFNRIFNFSFLNLTSSGLLSQFSTFFTGVLFFLFPWFFPQLLLEGSRRKARLVADENARRRQIAYPSWDN